MEPHVVRSFVGRVSSWMKHRKRKWWRTGGSFLYVCICVYVCVHVLCAHMYTRQCLMQFSISMYLIFESLSLDPELCHWLELLAVNPGASCCCYHHSSTDDTILPSFYLIAEHLNAGPYACLDGTLPALPSFLLALPRPVFLEAQELTKLEWVFPSQRILPWSILTHSVWSLVQLGKQ